MAEPKTGQTHSGCFVAELGCGMSDGDPFVAEFKPNSIGGAHA